ncbi:hypothetical protein SZ64_01715 [Erythrobacter sp. SG61-1L]|uniref:zinc-ribbon domain-containing protein n=1 Tax=Erythrobacter sp. SG61-1L TaxID=1603897 RepID=UPI0006C8F110|nr:zinc ribbon domain-containing protein [Erythrobacter sp. SG61-1L]KPL66924.1 hypothetical protein SZ64_01715 [Erythrobacter sp. SG61-1L]
MQRCGTCGAENREGVRFCTTCGGQLVLELHEELPHLPELELRSPTVEASRWWCGARRGAAAAALQALIPVATVAPFAADQGWAGFARRSGSHAADFMPGLVIEGTVLAEMFDVAPGDLADDGALDLGLWRGSLVSLRDVLRLHDGAAGGLERHADGDQFPVRRTRPGEVSFRRWKNEFLCANGTH